MHKRVEPTVNPGPSYGGAPMMPERRMEPPVNAGPSYGGGPMMNQKRMEPPVNTGGFSRMEPPVNSPGFFGMLSPFSGGPGNYLSTSSLSLLPALRGDETPEELKLRDEITELHLSAKQKYRHGKYLVNALMFLLCLGGLCMVAHQFLTVGSYATLDSRISLKRDPLDPERILISYTPGGTGKVGISREDETRRTQIIEHVQRSDVGRKKTFQWRIRGLKTGDLLELTSRDGIHLANRKVAVPDENETVTTGAGDGRQLSGRVISAITGQPLSGAEIRVRGTDISAKTDDEGNFTLDDVPSGMQSFEMTADGFTRENFQWNAAGAEPLRLAMSPGLDAGQIRVVLTWKEHPEDLDAHLEGPLPDGERFHISYQDKGDLKSKEFVQLDSDSQHGFGPESITVLGVLPGTYKYFVHDYTNRDSVDSDALARSGAEVKVYYGGQTYTFRPDANQAGNLWNVCEIDISDDGEAKVAALGTFEGKKIEGLGLYEKRMREDRMEWIANTGGSAGSEAAVTAALEWLARHQADATVPEADGSWGKYCLQHGDARCRCEEGARCDEAFPTPRTYAKEDYVMATTGLAVLAFQANGHLYDNEKKYSDTVRRGLDWIVRNQRANGLLITPTIKKHKGFSYHEKFMYEHGIASFALAEACAVAKSLGRALDPKYENAMRKAIQYTIRNQHLDGGWRYQEDKTELSDTSVTGWQVLALKSAKESGIHLDDKLLTGINLLFQKHTSHARGLGHVTEYQERINGTEALWGIGMLARQFLLNEANSDYVIVTAKALADSATVRWGRKTAEDVTDAPDYYLWYKCSLAMHQVGGRQWNRWNNVVRDTIIALQRKADCRAGSWDSLDDEWGDFGGRIYTTALAALTLEVYYRYATAEEQRSGMTGAGPVITEEEFERRREALETDGDSDSVLRRLDADLEGGRSRSKTSKDDFLKSMNEDIPEGTLEDIGRRHRREEMLQRQKMREAEERGETMETPPAETSAEPPVPVKTETPEEKTATPPAPKKKSNVLKAEEPATEAPSAEEEKPARRRKATATLSEE